MLGRTSVVHGVLAAQGACTHPPLEPNGEFHSDPVCTDPVRNFPTKRACPVAIYGKKIRTGANPVILGASVASGCQCLLPSDSPKLRKILPADPHVRK